ncbi:hypothetical protein EK21DRAFT_102930 [Setomelanomma holmii]|uniref:Uncharacterized protein n=1 Tax=Setomelanomma holmii TaxID=210430 RepID=A0A9P4LIQ7_9PLEO|nr:hypothetical protein EK21DRAFT_102930 [Setomelanomma holmii]
MQPTIMPTITEEAKLRSHLKDTLEDLPDNLTQYDELRLLDDLCFLLRSPLFLYTISPRLIKPSPRFPHEPHTPMSMNHDNDKSDNVFDMLHLEICIKWEDDSWTTELLPGENVLLEGRQLDVEQKMGFIQSFWWFCEEASFLAYEYKAREYAAAGARVALAKSNGRVDRRSLKLRIRFRDTVKGPAGVWIMDC